MQSVLCDCSNNSLFAVPANQEFVYVSVNQPEVRNDVIDYYMGQLRNNCTTVREGGSMNVVTYLCTTGVPVLYMTFNSPTSFSFLHVICP